MSLTNSILINWSSREKFVNVERQMWISTTQTQCYSVIVFFACLKLFDYLSVFKKLYRLIVMIEMMVFELRQFVIILIWSLIAFTVSEYIAYGYKDGNSYDIQRGFLARVFGLFSGDPVTFGHTDSGKYLGTFYVIIFLISVVMVLMNLIVAMLTSAYDQAKNQSADVLAQRHYDKMNQLGFTKRRPVTYVDENGNTIRVAFTTHADSMLTFLDLFDIKFVNMFIKITSEFENWLDAIRINWYKMGNKGKEKTVDTGKRIVVVSESKKKSIIIY